MSSSSGIKKELDVLRAFFKPDFSSDSKLKIDSQALEKLTRVMAKYLNKSPEAFLEKQQSHFFPKKTFRLIYQGKERISLDRITLSQYADLFNLKDLKDALMQAGLKEKHSFERESKSLLHGACFFGLPTLFCFLLNKKVSPDIQDIAGNTPLHVVLESPNLSEDQKHVLALTLLKDSGADILKPNTKGETPLHIACNQGLSKLVHLFLNANLMKPVVLKKRADPNAQDKAGNAPLHTLLESSVLTEGQKYDLAELLLTEYRADANRINENGETPLHLACARGLRTVVYLFLKLGAKAHIKDRNSKIPLDRISHLTKDQKVEIIEIYNKFEWARPDIKKIHQLMSIRTESQVNIQAPRFITPFRKGHLEILEIAKKDS